MEMSKSCSNSRLVTIITWFLCLDWFRQIIIYRQYYSLMRKWIHKNINTGYAYDIQSILFFIYLY